MRLALDRLLHLYLHNINFPEHLETVPFDETVFDNDMLSSKVSVTHYVCGSKLSVVMSIKKCIECILVSNIIKYSDRKRGRSLIAATKIDSCHRTSNVTPRTVVSRVISFPHTWQTIWDSKDHYFSFHFLCGNYYFTRKIAANTNGCQSYMLLNNLTMGVIA